MKQNKDSASANEPPPPLLALVRKQPFFKGLEPSQYQLLAELAIQKDFQKGEVIFNEGDPANRFYLILAGKVQLQFESREGLSVSEDVLGPGEDLGWTWLFPPYYFSSTAVAVEPTSTIFFYGTRLRQRCEDDHDLGYEIMKRIAQVAIKHLSAARQGPPASVPPPPAKRK